MLLVLAKLIVVRSRNNLAFCCLTLLRYLQLIIGVFDTAGFFVVVGFTLLFSILPFD